MQLTKLFLAAALATAIGAAGTSAQNTPQQEHHPDAGATAPAAPPAANPGQPAMLSPARPGMAMGEAAGMTDPGAGGSNMAMMRECMAMMASMMQRGSGDTTMPMMGERRGMMGSMMQGDMAGSAPDDPVMAAFAAINRRMHRDMAVPMSGNPDATFARVMIAHHQGAIDMARVILGFGSDPEIRKLAQEVITAQQGEIAFLQQWLARQPKP